MNASGKTPDGDSTLQDRLGVPADSINRRHCELTDSQGEGAATVVYGLRKVVSPGSEGLTSTDHTFDVTTPAA
jgi:hypothetical protein